MRISDWSSDVCSSDLPRTSLDAESGGRLSSARTSPIRPIRRKAGPAGHTRSQDFNMYSRRYVITSLLGAIGAAGMATSAMTGEAWARQRNGVPIPESKPPVPRGRSEEHTSELQSLMRISYAVFCLKKKTKHEHRNK